ncbi:hypothetical protein, partial [Streptomyces sp. Z38]|uniref:hypothetical protein n=1 Tax=Streptomyces sp. Z38 TaxID=2682780 RepID=UPI001E605CF7
GRAGVVQAGSDDLPAGGGRDAPPVAQFVLPAEGRTDAPPVAQFGDEVEARPPPSVVCARRGCGVRAPPPSRTSSVGSRALSGT